MPSDMVCSFSVIADSFNNKRDTGWDFKLHERNCIAGWLNFKLITISYNSNV